MRKIFYFLVLTLFTLHLTLSFVSAESFKILGSRPLGMGGAFVAVAEDSLAQYWNPAGLAEQKLFDLQLPVNLGAEFSGNVLNFVDDLGNLANDYQQIQTAQQGGGAINLTQIKVFFEGIKALDDLNKPGNGLLLDLFFNGNARFGNLAFSVNNFTSIGADPNIDVKNIGLKAPQVSAPKLASSRSLAQASGIDLYKLITELGASTDDPIDPELSQASGELAGTIKILRDELGVDLGVYTEGQIANALINYAGSQGATKEEIIQTIDTIKEVEALVFQIIGDANQTGYNENQSALTLKGASVVEIGVGYGRLFPYVQWIPLLKGLKVGANVKYLVGIVGFIEQKLLTGEAETDIGNISKEFDKYSKQSTAIGIDLGLLWDKRKTYRTSVGLLARNINTPKLKQPDVAIQAGEGDYYKLEPQLRAGVAFYPLKGFLGWLLAADIDLTKNSTPVSGYDSQLLSVGTEVNLGGRTWFNISARAGAMKNLAEAESKLTFTGGLGLNFLHLVLDLAAAVTPTTTRIAGGDKIPSSVSAALTLSVNF